MVILRQTWSNPLWVCPLHGTVCIESRRPEPRTEEDAYEGVVDHETLSILAGITDQSDHTPSCLSKAFSTLSIGKEHIAWTQGAYLRSIGSLLKSFCESLKISENLAHRNS